jgi:ferredoxin
MSRGDCQTCFMCELYCPADALYVAPSCEGPVALHVDAMSDPQAFPGLFDRTYDPYVTLLRFTGPAPEETFIVTSPNDGCLWILRDR